MSGRPGQLHGKARRDTVRRAIWQSMRILRSFCLPDLMRTAEAKLDNAKKFVAALHRHGYLREVAGSWRRGEPGAHKRWALVINPGPDHPLVCGRCGKSIMLTKECQPNEVQP